MFRDRGQCVLLVESDEALVKSASQDLRSSGYLMATATDTTSALGQIQATQPALIVLDRTLGSESGLKLCTRLRKLGTRTPILLMMARDTVDDRAACLEAGADDYLLKPYRSEAFMKLVKFYLRADSTQSEQLCFADLTLDLTTRQVYRGGRTIDLTMKEFELLKYMMEHPSEVLTREKILENVWGYDFMGESNVIEVYIRYLRLKIEDEGEKRLIQTVRGVGYVLRETWTAKD